MSELQAQAGCSKRCLDSDVESCVNGWPDGSCGARPRGTRWPKDVRARTDEDFLASAWAEQARAWRAVYDLCLSLGMDTGREAESGIECVLRFITGLARQ